MDFTGGSQATRFVTLALDPNEGKLAAWPLEVRSGGTISADDRVAVALLSHWPEQNVADALSRFASAGRTVVLFVQPSLATTWKALPDPQRAAWLNLLPADPSEASLASPAHVMPPAADQPLLGDVVVGADLESAQVRRMIRFDPNPRSAETVLSVTTNSSEKLGLLFRKPVGQGQVYTIATLPDSRFTNLATHPIFLPMLVRLALQSPEQRDALNVEIGQPITWSMIDNKPAMITVESPAHATFEVRPARDGDSGRFIFDKTDSPGLYTWRSAGAVIGYSNVQPPSSESELLYRAADSVFAPADNVIAAALAG